MFKVIKAGIVGGLIIFAWSAVSWTLLPWHMKTLNFFKDESAVVQTIQANVPQSGIYLLPNMSKNGAATSEQSTQPFVFAAVHLESTSNSMTKPMLISLAEQIIAAFLVAWLLLKTTGLSYMGRLGFVVIFSVAAGIIAIVPNWNWFAFDINYSLCLFADLLIGWFLAGLALAKICKK